MMMMMMTGYLTYETLLLWLCDHFRPDFVLLKKENANTDVLSVWMLLLGKKHVNRLLYKITLEWGGVETPSGLFPASLHFTHSRNMQRLPFFPPKLLHLFIASPTTFHRIPPLAVIRGDSNGKSDQVTGGHPTSLVFLPSQSVPLKSLVALTRPPPASDVTRLGRIDRHPWWIVERHSHCNLIKHSD